MGTIEKRGPNSWRVGTQVKTENGRKWVRHSLTFDAGMTEAQQRKQAEKALRQLLVDIDNGEMLPGLNLTVRSFSDIWMERYVLPNLAPVTASGYRHLLDRRILPKLGDVQLDRLSPGMIADFLADIRKEGRISQAKPETALSRPRTPSDTKRLAKQPDAPLSARTVRTYYNTLNQMLNKAVQWEMLAKNPMDKVDRPRYRQKPVKYLNDEQAVELQRMLKHEENMSFRCAVLLALTCGLRLGEVGALCWSDVDWKKCSIDICKAAKYTPQDGSFVGETKTEASERTITLPAGMMALLDETKKYQEANAARIGDRWHGVGRIVCNWDGRPLHHDTPSRQFRVFADRHGFEGVRFHDLRHTHATLLFASNIDAVAVASRLGHAKADTTLRIYAHALKRRDEDSAQAMQAFFDRADAPDDQK